MEEKEVRDAEVFMVSGGRATKWFASEDAAREYLGDRFGDPNEAIPFLKRMMLSEAFLRLNELELNNRLA